MVTPVTTTSEHSEAPTDVCSNCSTVVDLRAGSHPAHIDPVETSLHVFCTYVCKRDWMDDAVRR